MVFSNTTMKSNYDREREKLCGTQAYFRNDGIEESIVRIYVVILTLDPFVILRICVDA